MSARQAHHAPAPAPPVGAKRSQRPAADVAAGTTSEFNSVKLQDPGAHGAAAAHNAPAAVHAQRPPEPARAPDAGGFRQRLAAFGHAVGDAFDDALDRRPDEARLDALEDLARFRRKRFAPKLDFEPWTGHGKFDAELHPATGTLAITLRVGFEFLRGDPGLVEPGFRSSEFDWKPEEEARWKADALRSLLAVWEQRRLAISSTRPYWESVGIHPEVQIVEDASRTHVKVAVKKYPRDAKLITSAVFHPGWHPNERGKPDVNRAHDKSGTAALDSNDLRLEQKLDADNPVSEILFEQGSPDLDAAGRTALAPVAARLAADAGAHVELTGRASLDDVAGATPAEDSVANMDLARERTAAVHDALVARHVAERQILVRNAGQEGASSDARWRRVDVQVGTRELQLPLLHEGGHMLGSGDEYVGENGAAGQPLQDPAWAVAAKLYTGATLMQGYTASLMSIGSTLQPQHLAGFVHAVREITGREDWSV